MKAQEYLAQLEVIETRIGNLQFDMRHLQELALSITPSYEGKQVQASGSLQKMASTVDSWVDKEREMKSELVKLVNKRLEIAGTIGRLKKPKESNALHMLYIQKKSFKEVGQHYDKSESWAKSIHGRALQSLQKELDAKPDCSGLSENV